MNSENRRTLSKAYIIFFYNIGKYKSTALIYAFKCLKCIYNFIKIVKLIK